MRPTRQGEKENTGGIHAVAGMRMQSLDILRSIAMMMVVVLHFLGKGNLLGQETSAGWSSAETAAWVMESLCIVAVNIYMLISGYFLSASSFKLSRLIRLYLQVWVYSVGVGLIAVVLGIIPAAEVDTHYFLSLLFPISMGHYWFMTAYVFLYLLLPLLGFAVNRMTKKQFQTVLVLLLLVFCVLKSVVPFRLEGDQKGYDCLWYLCVFLVAAYIRKFGIRFLESKRRCACLYAGGCAGILAEFLVLHMVYLRTGHMELILSVSFEYNHLFVLLAAVGLFGLFLGIKAEHGFGKRVGAAAVKVSPYVLGVYLLHENLGLRYGWQNWFGANRIQTVPQLILGTVITVVCIFIMGVIVDWLRTRIMGGIHCLLMHVRIYQKLIAGVAKADEIFKRES